MEVANWLAELGEGLAYLREAPWREAPARSALLENFGLLWPPRTKSVIQFALPGAPQALGASRTNHSFGRFAPVSHFWALRAILAPLRRGV